MWHFSVEEWYEMWKKYDSMFSNKISAQVLLWTLYFPRFNRSFAKFTNINSIVADLSFRPRTFLSRHTSGMYCRIRPQRSSVFSGLSHIHLALLRIFGKDFCLKHKARSPSYRSSHLMSAFTYLHWNRTLRLIPLFPIQLQFILRNPFLGFWSLYYSTFLMAVMWYGFCIVCCIRHWQSRHDGGWWRPGAYLIGTRICVQDMCTMTWIGD